MQSSEEIKKVVKEKYGEIAAKKAENRCCCGTNKIIDYSMFKDDYSKIDGYLEEADLGLGCGVPTEYAGMKKGDTVVDLGSGAGNDVFVARSIVGGQGRVVGLDFTQEMIAKANANNAKVGFKNVEFKLGEIESIPLENAFADVVISNCVLNLVPDKRKAFAEIYRILKPGAHFCVSDIVIKGELPAGLKKSAEMYAGCVSGALQQDEYLGIIKETGFENIEIKQTKVIELPDEVLKDYLSEAETENFKQNKVGIFSITVVGYKSYMKKRILILCTGNSCRSQMAEGFLKSIDKNLEVYSAGTQPAERVNPFAIKAMKEIGIDISNGIAKNVDKYLKQSFDFVITVCDHAKETCPAFLGEVKHRLHIGFDDPADAVGTEEEVMPVYRRVRDEIKRDFYEFYQKELKAQ